MLLKTYKQKIFCIGLNKTGTTTIEKVLKDFGYRMGNQAKAELLLENWYKRDFKSINDFCKKAEAFQDVPFSLPLTYMFLDQQYPNSKFILTERNSPEQWYDSIVKFHSKLWATDGVNIRSEDLKKATYRYKGYAFEYNNYVFNTPFNEPYKEELLKSVYINHNQAVKEYFRSQPNKLLVINVANREDYFKLCSFLDKKPKHETFPWENKTSSL